jgi:SAM-dependent methyltransferase
VPHEHTHSGRYEDRHDGPEDFAAYLARLEDPEREAWQKPDEVVAALAPGSDARVCDLGAGPGYFTFRLPGHVHAVEIDPRMAEVLLERIRARGVRNVTPVLACPEDPLLPDGTFDLVLMVNVFHHVPDGATYLRRLSRALRPGGRIANIDFHKRDLPMGPPLVEKIDRADFLKTANAAGLRLAREHTFLPHQYFLELVG